MVVHCKWTVPGLPTGGYVVKLYDFSGLLPYYEPMWVDSNDGTDKAALRRHLHGHRSGLRHRSGLDRPLHRGRHRCHVPRHHGRESVRRSRSRTPSSASRRTTTTTIELAVATDALGVAHFDRIGEGDFVAEITTDDAATLYHPDVNHFTITRNRRPRPHVHPRAGHELHLHRPGETSHGRTPTSVRSSTSVVPPTTMDDGSGIDQDVDYRYQWYRGATAIFGADDDSYVTKSGDVGSMVSVVVTASTFGFADIVAGRDRGRHDRARRSARSSTGSPVITSPAAPKPGVVLTASPGTWDLSGLRFSYQWMRDGVPIPLNGTSRTYTLTLADASHDVTVEVTAKKPGLQDSAPAVSDPAHHRAAPCPGRGQELRHHVLDDGPARRQRPLHALDGHLEHPRRHAGTSTGTSTACRSRPTRRSAAPTRRRSSSTPTTTSAIPWRRPFRLWSSSTSSGTRPRPARISSAAAASPLETTPGGVTSPWSSTPFTDIDNVSWGDPLIVTPPVLSYPTMSGNTVVTQLPLAAEDRHDLGDHPQGDGGDLRLDRHGHGPPAARPRHDHVEPVRHARGVPVRRQHDGQVGHRRRALAARSSSTARTTSWPTKAVPVIGVWPVAGRHADVPVVHLQPGGR